MSETTPATTTPSTHELDQNLTFSESFFYNSVTTTFKVTKVLHTEQSPWQKIDVYQTEGVGKLLTLNDKTMVSEKDEFVYHEVMSHIPYMVSRDTKKVLIIGGGDGGVVREFCRYSSIEQIDLVEIDQRVIDVSKIYFPECTVSLDDPRVKIYAEDGIKFIEGKENEYDIIVVDSTDPEDFASGLFTDTFYASVKKALTEAGIMVAQTENPFYDQFNIRSIYDNLRKAFPIVQSYSAPMIIYPGVNWTFAFASKVYRSEEIYQPKLAEFAAIADDLKWYNLDWHQAAFKMPNFHKKMLGFES